jgi:hypothetical protein
MTIEKKPLVQKLESGPAKGTQGPQSQNQGGPEKGGGSGQYQKDKNNISDCQFQSGSSETGQFLMQEDIINRIAELDPIDGIPRLHQRCHVLEFQQVQVRFQSPPD